VKGGIETGDVGHARKSRLRGPDPGQIVRLVQRRKGREGFEIGHRLGRQQRRFGIIGPAMHDAVTDHRHRARPLGRLDRTENRLERVVVAVDARHLARVGTDDLQLRGDADRLHLAGQPHLRVSAGAPIVKAELDRRGAGIEREDAVGHCGASVLDWVRRCGSAPTACAAIPDTAPRRRRRPGAPFRRLPGWSG
jgi:hypothetical protein